MQPRTTLFTVFVLFFCLVLNPGIGRAQQAGLAHIRDAEIENTIRLFATPLFQAAGLSPEAVNIHIINNPQLNAFVANGQNLYLFTGLLMRSESPNQLIGVIAHETGHMAGGHLIRLSDNVARAQSRSLLAAVAGLAAGIASGRSDVGMAVMQGGQEAAKRSFLSFSREQEMAADQAAVTLLDATDQSARGLEQFFDILGDQEVLLPNQQDPYVRTHPLSRQRMDFVRHHVSGSSHSAATDSQINEELHARMRAKLKGFLDAPMQTLATYKEDDPSIASRYARAFAYYRRGDMEHALPLVDGLIKDRPNDPYFLELKGQALFENGRGNEALAPYRKAVQLAPHEALLRISLAQILIENGDPALLDEATTHLKVALGRERETIFGWRLLGIAYGRQDQMGMAAFAMAEEALLLGKALEAQKHAQRAEAKLPKGSPVLLRVRDIIAAVETAKERAKNR